MSTEEKHETEAETLRQAVVDLGPVDARVVTLVQGLVTTIAEKNAKIEQLEATILLLRTNRA
jgi:hypothetical protein